MKYIYKEYNHVFDTPAKKEQETVVINKIMDLLNKNKYDNINEFIERNQTYQDFLKNNNLETVVKHFGNTLNETDFKRLLEEMVKLTNQKKDFDKENIKTKTVDNKQYNIYEGKEKNFFFDNSHSDMNIERQMEELQKTQNDFQSSDNEKNTENMMNELEKSKKESLKLSYITEINVDKLTQEQREIYEAMLNYQLGVNMPVRIDIERGLIIDQTNNIISVKKTDGEYVFINEDNQTRKADEIEQPQEEKSMQKKLMPSKNTIYSDNN